MRTTASCSLTIRYGLQDDQSAALRQAVSQGLEVAIDANNAAYFISKITIVRGEDPGMRSA